MFGKDFTMAQKPTQKTKRRWVNLLPLVTFALVLSLGFVSAATPAFDEVLKPLTTVYNLVKYAATVIAGLVMLFAGITYISSGSDPGKREKAKNMVMYVIVGLIVIWAAPFVVDLILG